MSIADLDTPVPIINLDLVEHNIQKAQNYCDAHGIALRPHIKTHKLPGLAHKQLEAGAVGITCQKISEAATMAAAGIGDILLSYNIVGRQKVEPLAQLARSARLSVAIDNAVALATVAEGAKLAEHSVGILIEFESGTNRTGVQTPQEALELAEKVEARDFLEFRGFMTYPLGERARDFLESAMPLFEDAGLKVEVVSAGGTPNMWQTHTVPGVTELRPGTYIYHDRATVAKGAATLEECALHVHATVVSRPTPDRVVIDAGSKTLSSDRIQTHSHEAEPQPGYGLVLEYPKAIIERLNEEHGIIDLSACQGKPEIGERVRIVPNHVCVVTNLHDEVVAHRDGQIEGVWSVPARGKTR